MTKSKIVNAKENKKQKLDKELSFVITILHQIGTGVNDTQLIFNNEVCPKIGIHFIK